MMRAIKISHIVSFSSEDKVHKADHLLKPETYYKWKCATPGEKKATVTVQLETPSVIHYVDIGNEHSAFVEILVKRSADRDKDFQALLVASSFMSPLESRNGTNANRVRMFDTDKLAQNLRDEKWDTVQIVCTQPFNKNIQYGLSFIKFHSPSAPSETSAKESNSKETEVKIGKFKLKNDDKEQSSLTVGHYYMKKKKEETFQTSPSVVKHSSFAAATLAKLEGSSSPDQNVASQKRKLMDDAISSASNPPVKKSPVTHVKKEKIGYKNIFGSDSDDSGPSTSVKVKDIKKNIPKTPPTSQRDKITETKTDRNSIVKDVSSRTQTNKNSVPKNVASSTKLRDEKEKGMYKKQTPFNKIMTKVVFVLSGFQNPFRSEIRDAALEMGAKYKGDWDSTCTHLICAFVNTPKYSQVLSKGGRIVKKEWVFDCHKQKKLLPWRKYMLGKYSKDSTTDEEEEEEEEEKDNQMSQKTLKGSEKVGSPSSASPKTQIPNHSPKPSTKAGVIQKSLFPISQSETNDYGNSSSEKSEEDYLADTDVDSDSGGDTEDEFKKLKQRQADRVVREQKQQSSGVKNHLQPKDTLNDTHDNSSDYKNGSQLQKTDTTDIPLIELPNLFKGKYFYLYGEFSDEELHNLERYITAYNGRIADYMGQDVKYVVTKSKWSECFDDALTENDDLIFVRPAWIHKCHQNEKLVPFQPFIIVPDS